MNNYNEQEIAQQLQDPSKCRKAFEQVVKAYSEQLYWQIRRMVLSHDDANDLLQNTFIKAGAIWNISGEMPSSRPGSTGSRSMSA